MINLCLEPFDFKTVENDSKRSLQCRHRMTLKNLKNPNGPFKQANRQRDLDFLTILKIPERFSLVPYDNYRHSLIQVHRNSNLFSNETARRSILYEKFSSRQKESFADPSMAKLTVNKDKMLNFFMDH